MVLWRVGSLVQGKFSDSVCGWSHMRLQACMSGQDYFQFSYWLEPSTLPGLRCWLTVLLSLSLPPTCPLAVSLHCWPAGMENQPLMGLRGLEEGTAGLVERMKVPGGAACTD